MDAERSSTASGRPTTKLLTRARAGDRRLVVRTGGGEWIVGRARQRLAFGRTRESDVRIMDDLVSRDHGRIEYRDGTFVLVDTSSNGTIVTTGSGSAEVHQNEHAISSPGTITLGHPNGPQISFVIEEYSAERTTWEPVSEKTNLAEHEREGGLSGTARVDCVRIVVFTDMVGSTQTLERLGDARAQRVLHTHNEIIRNAARAYGGTEIKHTGDGFLLTFPSAISATRCAVEIQQTLGKHRQAHPDALIEVRIGMNAGEPITDDGDLYGATVSAAARICAKAASGEILVSDVVRQLLAGSDVRLAARGRLTLKGFRGHYSLYAVDWPERPL